MTDWPKRRKNIRILCAAQGISATQLANAINLSPNTLTKFLNSTQDDRALSPKSLSLVLQYFGLQDEADLDSDNPLDDPRASLRKIVSNLTPEQTIMLNRELLARFQND